jgi:hypothetical protein
MNHRVEAAHPERYSLRSRRWPWRSTRLMCGSTAPGNATRREISDEHLPSTPLALSGRTRPGLR